MYHYLSPLHKKVEKKFSDLCFLAKEQKNDKNEKKTKKNILEKVMILRIITSFLCKILCYVFYAVIIHMSVQFSYVIRKTIKKKKQRRTKISIFSAKIACVHVFLLLKIKESNQSDNLQILWICWKILVEMNWRKISQTLNLDLLKLSRENKGSQINQSISGFYEFVEKNLVETKRVNLWIFPCPNNLAKMNGVKYSACADRSISSVFLG